jgi:hypothetical protein
VAAGGASVAGGAAHWAANTVTNTKIIIKKEMVRVFIGPPPIFWA